jgi:hypothetical protein
MERAASNLAAREQQLRRDRDLAEALAELAKDQQAARDEIAKAAEMLEQAAGQPLPGKPSKTQMAAAQELQQAQGEFAAAQRATGEGAAEISGQEEVANQPIREGLEAASRLTPTPAEGMPMGEGQPTGEGQPMGEGKPAGEGQGQPMGQGQGQPMGQGQGQPMGEGQGQGQGQGQGSGELGTGLVPSSPKVTAQQIAGAAANAAAQQAMAAQGKGQPGQGQQLGQGTQPGQGQGQGQQQMPGQASSTASTGGAATQGKSTDNQKAQPGELQNAPAAQADSRGKAGEGDSDAARQKFEAEPWFAKLPPSLRSAIQSKARGKAPRGYEERLRRYFESVD